MATKKQRKRSQKERRHEYETVWVDSEGNELDEAPDDYVAPAPREKRADGKKPQPKRPQRPLNPRTPLPPSWRRAAKRSLILGAVIFVLFGLLVRTKDGGHAYGTALSLAVLYTALFIPFTYGIDRFAYRRWQRKTGGQPTKR